jgi:hypothetical protein
MIISVPYSDEIEVSSEDMELPPYDVKAAVVAVARL